MRARRGHRVAPVLALPRALPHGNRYRNPHSGNEKGSVENAAGFIRRNLLVPVPKAGSVAELNALLREGLAAAARVRRWPGDAHPGRRASVPRARPRSRSSREDVFPDVAMVDVLARRIASGALGEKGNADLAVYDGFLRGGEARAR